MKQIGNIIREHRVAQNLTQEELGQELHVTKQAVSKWETGRTLPDVETLRRLSDVLSIDLSVLLDGSLKGAAKSNRRKNSLIVALSGLLLVLVTGLAVAWIQDNVRPAYVVYGRDTPNPDAIVVTMEQLLADPETYDGFLVRVMGVGSLRDEFNCLYASTEDWEYDTESAVGLVWGECSPEYIRNWRDNGRYVTVEGFFDADDSACGDRFRSCIRDVNLYESHIVPVRKLTERYTRVVKEQNGTYTLTVLDHIGSVMYTREGMLNEPNLVLVDENVLMVETDNTRVYCRLRDPLVSEIFTNVLWNEGIYLMHLVKEGDAYYVVSRHAFASEPIGEKVLLKDAVWQKLRPTVRPWASEDCLEVTYYTTDSQEKTVKIPYPSALSDDAKEGNE